MKQTKFIILFLVCVFTFLKTSLCQTTDKNLDFELKVQEKFKRLQKNTDDELRTSINDSIYQEIKSWLKDENTFDYELDTLESIGYLKSEDGIVKIITWNFPLMEGYNQFFGFIQYKENNQIKTIELKFNENALVNLGGAISYPNNWYGALYYKIIHSKYKGENTYTLLGFIPNDLFTSKKVIDVLNISDNGLITLGKPIFQTKEGVKNRLVFEYSARVVMKLNFSSKMDMIVYDHLSPSSPNYKGRYQFYGPDFSYDGLKFENGIWQEYQDITIEY